MTLTNLAIVFGVIVVLSEGTRLVVNRASKIEKRIRRDAKVPRAPEKRSNGKASNEDSPAEQHAQV